MEQKEIVGLASKFRTALEKLAVEPEAFWKTITNRFPNGCCDDASMLFAAYLADHGYPGAMWVHGENGGRTCELKSHVWLELGGLIIDLTADQFGGYDLPAVLVTPFSSFHQGFEVKKGPEIADFRTRYAADERALLYLKAMYQKAVKLMPY